MPMTMPRQDEAQSRLHDEAERIRRFRAQGHAHANFMRLLRRRIRQHAVDAHCDQHQANGSEGVINGS